MCNCQLTPQMIKRAKGLGTTGVQTAISSGGAGAGLVAGIIAGTAFGGPIGSLVGGAISIASGAIATLFTPDYTKIYASNDANETATLLQTNLNGWNSLQASQKIPAVQQFFIQNYETLWESLVSYCSNPQLGTAGQNCIADRSPSGKYPWNQYYLDPIQNDPSVVPQVGPVTFQDPLTGTNITVQPQTASGLTSSAGAISSSIASTVFQATGFQVSSNEILIGGLALLAILILK